MTSVNPGPDVPSIILDQAEIYKDSDIGPAFRFTVHIDLNSHPQLRDLLPILKKVPSWEWSRTEWELKDPATVGVPLSCVVNAAQAARKAIFRFFHSIPDLVAPLDADSPLWSKLLPATDDSTEFFARGYTNFGPKYPHSLGPIAQNIYIKLHAEGDAAARLCKMFEDVGQDVKCLDGLTRAAVPQPKTPPDRTLAQEAQEVARVAYSAVSAYIAANGAQASIPRAQDR